jgi:mitochondrial fission protein ELM1
MQGGTPEIVTRTTQPPTVWAVHDGKIGMINQVTGLAEALGWPIVQKELHVRAPWSRLPPRFWWRPFAAVRQDGDDFAPPWPDVIIACGRNTVALARAAKRASGNRLCWVQVQDPRFARGEADLLVVPGHDPATGGNVIRTLGAVHRVTPARLAEGAQKFAPMFAGLPRPLVAVLIGGSNRAYRLTGARLAQLADDLAALAGQGVGLAITVSRRTLAEGGDLLRQRLEGLPAIVWDGSGDNPYFGMLGLADAIIATADSVSMVSEAAATGKPVHVVELDGGSRKFAAFHQAMRDAGITRPFRGAIEHWDYAPPDDTARAAQEIRRLVRGA